MLNHFSRNVLINILFIFEGKSFHFLHLILIYSPIFIFYTLIIILLGLIGTYSYEFNNESIANSSFSHASGDLRLRVS